MVGIRRQPDRSQESYKSSDSTPLGMLVAATWTLVPACVARFRLVGVVSLWLLASVFAIGCDACAGNDSRALAALGLALTMPPGWELPEPWSARPERPQRPQRSEGPRWVVSAPPSPSRIRTAALPEATLVPYRVLLRPTTPGQATVAIAITTASARPLIGLALTRSEPCGRALVPLESAVQRIAHNHWLVTRLGSAEAKSGAVTEIAQDPAADAAVEYALASAERLYRVCVRGSARAVAALAARIAPTLRAPLASPSWVRALAGDELLTQPPAADVAPAVVVVVAATWAESDRSAVPALRPRAVGAGTVIDVRGTVMTSAHGLYADPACPDCKPGWSKPYDRFAIGRYRAGMAAPHFVCLGEPQRGRIDRALDLALIDCHQDMSGRPWQDRGWFALAPEINAASAAQAETVGPGTPLWALGFPVERAGALAVASGRVLAWSGEGPRDDPAQRRFLTTDAAVTPGFSGGPLVTTDGTLIGIAAGYRDRFAVRPDGIAPDGLTKVGTIGLVRPLALALPLLAND